MKTSANDSACRSELFHVPIQGWSLDRLLKWCLDPAVPTPKWIVTANPEILLMARRLSSYAETLRQADTICVDGFGLWLVLRLKGFHVARVTGVALAEQLIQQAAHVGWKVGFLGGNPGIAQRVATHWQHIYPSLRAVAEQGGTILPDGSGDAAEDEAVHRLVLHAPDVLFVAFGGGTKQESWIARRMQDLPSSRVVVGVGGAFDFWSGRLVRAPRWLQAMGLEWLWRLIQEPQRIGRIVRATIVFPFTVLWDALCHKRCRA